MLVDLKIAESDITAQARIHAAQLGQNIQSGTRGAAESFNRFVEGPRNDNAAPLDEDKKEFWDSFGKTPGGGGAAGGAGDNSKSSAIGTAAMRKGH